MKIVYTGGGTLGPVTPLLAVIERLRVTHPDAQALFVGTRGGVEEGVVREVGVPFVAIASGKWRRYASLDNLLDVARVLRGTWQAFWLLGRERADAVVGAGGFVAVPVAVAAWLRRIPVHVHQLDLQPGLANRICAWFATSASVSFPELVASFAPRLRPVCTGTPIRPRVLAGSAEEGRRLLGLEPSVPTLLVLGGGTGAMGLNHLVAESLPVLTGIAQVVHLTGKGKEAPMPTPTPRYHPFPFLGKELPHAFAAADVVVTRAGIGTLVELAALAKPCLMVPIPASQQEANAAYFAAHGGGVSFAQAQGADAFVGAVQELLARAGAAGSPHPDLAPPDAADRVGALVLGLVRR
jgi:UDP-N-acetylglucosamine--N-acetylmuramyl-(pentapeptide) pyrophosphoryl-undecaprenol N-acetylglucosamine transferase